MKKEIINPIDNDYVNILLIDDDEDEYIIARDLFMEIGNNYHVSWFSDFHQALNEFRKEIYDICLCDYHMGRYNGIQFIEQAVSVNYNTPIILLTGQGDHETDIIAMKAGAIDYLDKNKLDSDKLSRAVRYALERKKTAQKIKHLAFYDQLTNLPNRTLFLDRVHSVWASAKRYNRLFAIMFLDIDNFKRINDSLGHDIGDLLIKQVSQMLVKSIRREDTLTSDHLSSGLDTVARLGGDEFIILLSEIKNAENVSKIAERIRNELISPIMIEDKMVNVTISMGIAIYPNDGSDVETLMKNSDIAMYNAKSTGKNRYQYYNGSMNTAASLKLNLENELHRAINNNEFTFYYQPIIDLKSKQVCAIEALVRWMHPEKGIVLPDYFMNSAEDTGLIVDLEKMLFKIICNHYNSWKKEFKIDINIVINISSRQLNRNGFTNTVKELADSLNIHPEKIIFEITENSIIHKSETSVQIIKALRDMGIKISLDDFGAGYASFNILKDIDVLKIDRSLILNIPEKIEDSTIVSSLISIGHSMNMKIIAEGVETEEQLAFLKSEDCNMAQGYLFSVPVPEDNIEEILKRKTIF